MMRDLGTCTYEILLRRFTPGLKRRLECLEREGVFTFYDASDSRLYVWADQEQLQHKHLVESTVKAEGCEDIP